MECKHFNTARAASVIEAAEAGLDTKAIPLSTMGRDSWDREELADLYRIGIQIRDLDLVLNAIMYMAYTGARPHRRQAAFTGCSGRPRCRWSIATRRGKTTA